MKIKIMKTLLLMLIGVTIFSACGGGGSQDNQIIIIGHSPYDYELPSIEVTKILAEELGYAVEIVEGDIGFMFASLDTGDIDIWPGVWLPSIHKTYQEQYQDKYELGSAIFENAPIGWAVPKYVDIDSIEEIKGNEALFNGKVIGLEPGAGMMMVSEQIIDAYDLDMELVSGSTSSMLAEAEYAVSQQEPIIILGWRPHTMMVKYDLKILDESKGYWEEDSQIWGINKKFADKAPEIYNLVKNFKMNIDDHEDFLLHVENGGNPSEWAQQWIEAHRAEIDNWLSN
jgi:glycine betaine/proline transport system substrate-binding protein